jgi:hypothetical protein
VASGVKSRDQLILKLIFALAAGTLLFGVAVILFGWLGKG